MVMICFVYRKSGVESDLVMVGRVGRWFFYLYRLLFDYIVFDWVIVFVELVSCVWMSG